eukprot:6822382-Karenia_brevis.AAC.1
MIAKRSPRELKEPPDPRMEKKTKSAAQLAIHSPTSDSPLNPCRGYMQYTSQGLGALSRT